MNMNSTLKTLLNHRSIRKYSSQKIEKEKLDYIIQAACNGSTMGNLQLYSIIITEDAEMKAKAAPFHFNQPMVTEAPLLLTFCADLNRFSKYCQYREAETTAYDNLQSYHWAVTDALIAAQNACVAAESLGLGICWLGTITFNCDKFIELFELPPRVFPIASISFGYPKETPELTDKLPHETFIHYEKYKDYSEEAINKIYSDKEQHPNTLALFEENNLNNLARIFTERRYKKEDNEYFSKILVEVLKKQKFLDSY
jgi:nitroreductase